jgi:peptidoglycan/xylan/chitin deacetylase (PgdA/CDA1 family)
MSRRRPSRVCVLTLHGLQEDAPDAGLLDQAAHLPVSFFAAICEHLAKHYKVVPVSAVAAYHQGQAELPERAVALTFDDGYASNFHLGLPLLRRYGLPATVYLTTGFVDGSLVPWFVKLEHALAATELMQMSARGQPLGLMTTDLRRAAYGRLCSLYKSLPHVDGEAMVAEVLEQLGVTLQLPAPLRPMDWNMAREMQASGLVELGGHTHSHPILARCVADVARDEVQLTARRLREELGDGARTFAYPNGQPGDITPAVMEDVERAGFTAGFNMTSGFVMRGHHRFDLHRYGNPRSVAELEAVASSSMERYAGWKRRLTRHG